MKEDQVFEYQQKINAEFLFLVQTVLPSYASFRGGVRNY